MLKISISSPTFLYITKSASIDLSLEDSMFHCPFPMAGFPLHDRGDRGSGVGLGMEEEKISPLPIHNSTQFLVIFVSSSLPLLFSLLFLFCCFFSAQLRLWDKSSDCIFLLEDVFYVPVKGNQTISPLFTFTIFSKSESRKKIQKIRMKAW